MVANQARNRRTAAQRRANLALRAGAGQADDHEPTPELVALARERRQALLCALATLREEERLVVAYRYFLDLSEAEAAEALGCPRGTVKSRLSRALQRLRARLSGRAAGQPQL